MTNPNKTPELSEIRCDCGKLLARRVDRDTIELKCKRCRRCVNLSISDLTTGTIELTI